MKEADFYRKLTGKKVRCVLCPRECEIPEGGKGFCRVRKNVDGKLYSLVYGRPCSIAVDPIEKKPLFHFAPGSECVSIATVGCNLACRFCQNWQISQEFREVSSEEVPVERLISLAKEQGAGGFAYTYTEPTVFFEYAFEVMKAAKKEGFYNVWVSNGYTSPEVIRKMSKYLDAVNVDIKGNDQFYRKVSMASKGIEPVFEALKEYKKNRIWIEVTNLIIPMYNDSKEEIGKLVKWIRSNLGKNTPVHFSAFYPDYKLTDAPPTPGNSVETAVKIAKRMGMKWVYAGNLRSENESTTCPKCGTIIIRRTGFTVISYNDKCPKCGTKAEIKGKKWIK
ncbi:MAG: AmmeMemoRadiSam system radical SAM enzyme [Candidatus Aenigmarchaeota archaeon]|nr:AmmeMemoRadiSam system radical SAM enzyme [Candidatus Aenigmarchaeota archaeon]